MEPYYLLISFILINLEHSFLSSHSLDNTFDNLLKLCHLFKILKLLYLLLNKLQSKHLHCHFCIRIIS